MYSKTNGLSLSILLFIIFSFSCFAQNDEEIIDTVPKFNKWSIEFNIGQNNPVKPFTTGYFTNNPNTIFFDKNLNHFVIGTRYMITTNIGIGTNVFYDNIIGKSRINNSSFTNSQIGIDVQGYFNFGRILKFEEFSKNITLFLHTGINYFKFKANQDNNKLNDNNYAIIAGITPMVRINNYLALKLDYSIQNNLSQNLSWDGRINEDSNNLNGMIHYYSLGLTFYMKFNRDHADWYLFSKKDMLMSKLTNYESRIKEIEIMMNDVDRDGIVDYLDVENNTPSGLQVDSKGRFIDINNNGTPDELEKSKSKETIEVAAKENTTVSFADLLNQGFINIFYDLNKYTLNAESTNMVYNLLKFMKSNDAVKIKITGFSDNTGTIEYNTILSQKRVEYLKNEIVKNGISPERITVVGSGIESLTTKNTNKFSRRVSIELLN
jgi:OOP family OmpA-OmpF porin